MKRNAIKTVLTLITIIVCMMMCAAAHADENGMLRIRLTRLGTTDSITLRADCSYTIKETGTALPAGASLEVSLQGGILSLRCDGSEIASGVSITLLRGGSNAEGISFIDPQLSHLYCGDLSLTASGSVITPILTIYIEDYLYGVVADALPESASTEVLKAEAIAARSYAMCKRGSSSGTAYDLTDSSADQTFTGLDITRIDATTAVEETRGQVLTANGKIAACYTTRSNGGQTESAENVWGTKLSYSKVQTDSYDAESATAVSRTAVIGKDGSNINAQLRSALLEGIYAQLETWGLSTADSDVRITSVDSITAGDPKYEGGQLYKTLTFNLSVQSVNLSTGKPVRSSAVVDIPTYGGIEAWYGLSINDSDNETVTVFASDSGYSIIFRREGHGIGMSLSGARVMSEAYGKRCEDILQFYYPDTRTVTYTYARENNGASAAVAMTLGNNSGSPFALPTLVPIATAVPTEAPTATPAPTEEPASINLASDITFIDLSDTQTLADTQPEAEPTSTVSVPPLFRDLPTATASTGTASSGSFIAGTTKSDNVFEPDATVAVPQLTAATAKPTQKPSSSADEYDLADIDLPSGINDINYSVSDSVLGAMASGNEEDALAANKPQATAQPKATAQPAKSQAAENIDFSTSSDSLIDKNVSDEDVPGPMADGDEMPDEELEIIEEDVSSMKAVSGTVFGVITVQENSTLTLRSAPSVDSAALGYIISGDVVRVYGYNDSWLAVLTRKGSKGYIARSYVTAVTAEEAKAAWQAAEQKEAQAAEDAEAEDAFVDLGSRQVDIVVCDFMAHATSNVRLHQDADLASPTLVIVGINEYVHVTAYNDMWAYVEYANVQGFIARDYLQKD